MLNKNRLLISWDEFSHWGLVAKNMHYFDALSFDPREVLWFRGYPPFAAIWEYFFTKVGGEFKEESLFIAMNILQFSIVMPILKNITWKKVNRLLIYVPVMLAIPLIFFDNFYTTIYVDACLGIFLAYILYIYYTEKIDLFTLRKYCTCNI